MPFDSHRMKKYSLILIGILVFFGLSSFVSADPVWLSFPTQFTDCGQSNETTFAVSDYISNGCALGCTYQVIDQGSGVSSASITGGDKLSYTMDASSFTGSDTITIEADDGWGGTTNNVMDIQGDSCSTPDTTDPVVNLSKPYNGSTYYDTNSIKFNFTVVDNCSSILNCSLWGNFTGEWKLNQTNNSQITEGSLYTFFTGLQFPIGSYIWNVQCYDNASTPNEGWGNHSDGNNYSLAIDDYDPALTFTTPSGILYDNEDLIFNFSLTFGGSGGITNCSLMTNETGEIALKEVYISNKNERTPAAFHYINET